jgi:branched-chain amino acid transport system permease protein
MNKLKALSRLVLPGALIVLAALTLSPYYGGLALMAVTFAMLGLSVNLVYGYLGYLSFGHAAFFGLGAYTAALLYANAGLPFALAAVLALVLPTILGALVGFASLRVSGAYFAIATLASAEILRLVATSWVSLTRGPLGTVIPAPALDSLESLGMSLHRYHLVIAAALLCAVMWLVYRLLRSPVGRSWLAIRESIQLAESVGIPTLRIRVVNIALSGGIAGLAGALLVPKVLVVSPDLFAASYSAVGLLIVILGGRGTIAGALIGGVIFAVLPETLRAVDQYRMIIFAVLLLIAVRTQSGGVVELARRLFNWRGQSAGAAPVLAGKGCAPAQAGAVDAAGPAPAVPVQRPAAPAGQKDSTPVLQVQNLVKQFQGVRAVDGSNFTINSGEIFGIIGPNGAGKTTLLKLISGFETPTSGTVVALGRDVAGMRPYEIAKLGVVRTFQHTELYRGLSVLENVLIGAYLVETSSTLACILQGKRFRAAEARRKQTALRVLKLVGLEAQADARADALSYGDQKLLSIALALAAEPRVLLLDEPAAGLNHSEANRLRTTLMELKREGITLAIVDHNLELMMSTCDRILVVHHGVPITIGAPEEVVQNETVRQAYLG